jgi:hypothetical protein
MNLKELGSLKYFIAFIVVFVGFYIYSGIIGWKWLGSTSTEKNKTEKNGTYHPRYFHK